MSKNSPEGFPWLQSRKKEVPEYPTHFGSQDNIINDDDYDFSVAEALFEKTPTVGINENVNRDYNLKTIGGFIDVNKHPNSEEKEVLADEEVS